MGKSQANRINWLYTRIFFSLCISIAQAGHVEAAGRFASPPGMVKDSCVKTYSVRKITSPPVIDGLVEESVWQSASLMTDLALHWETVEAQQTRYRALYDEKQFYFLFEVADSNVVIWDSVKSEMDVIWEDRVEMFLAPDRQFRTYYCLEIDALGRYLGNSGSLGKKIDPEWECTGCLFRGRLTKNGYTLEGAIPLRTLQEMGVYTPGKKANIGVYRADFNPTGIPTSPEMHWISWVKSDSPTPSFHIPSSMGCFEFVD
jgi:hypothetical protein